jgi:hypothetical protein
LFLLKRPGQRSQSTVCPEGFGTLRYSSTNIEHVCTILGLGVLVLNVIKQTGSVTWGGRLLEEVSFANPTTHAVAVTFTKRYILQGIPISFWRVILTNVYTHQALDLFDHFR